MTDAFDKIELELMIHAETEHAVLVSADGAEDAAMWCSKALLDFQGPIRCGKAQIVTMDIRLAETKGLL